MDQVDNTHLSYLYEGHNLVCAVDIKTNGPSPGVNDLTELNVLPLDHDFQRSGKFPPFHTRILPRRRNSLSKLAKTEYDLLDYDRAYEIFDSWFDLLKLRSKGRITVLTFNWAHVKAFLNDFFGHDTDGTLFSELYFRDDGYKDIKSTLVYLKDVAHRKLPGFGPLHLIHSADNLHKAMSTLHIAKSPDDNYYHNCIDMAKIYKELIEIITI